MADDAKTIVHAYLAALWAGDRATAKQLLAPNAEWWFLPSLGYPRPMSAESATDAILDDMMSVFDTSAEFAVELHVIICEGCQVAAEYTARATKANGDAYENRYCLTARTENGLIVEVRPYTDTKILSDLMAEAA